MTRLILYPHRLSVTLVALVSFAAAPACAQDDVASPPGIKDSFFEQSLFKDNNGTGAFEIVAFGDSITRGTGDFIATNTSVSEVGEISGEAGYPLRVESLVGVLVSNFGNPGERLIEEGVRRFAATIPAVRPDIVIISEGANDAISGANSKTYFRSMQTLVNIARASGVQPVVATIPPQCCDRAARSTFTSLYNSELKNLAVANDLPLADVNKAFLNTCGSNDCFLLNRPEGLHPNIEGYDVIGETVIAALLQISLFAPDGPATLEDALNLPEDSVRTIPDPESSE